MSNSEHSTAPPGPGITRSLTYAAVEALHLWAGPRLSREEAAGLLPQWKHFPALTPDMIDAVLAQFEAAVPVGAGAR